MSDLVTPWTVVLQAPLSMGFSRQEYWRGLPFSSPGDPPDPELEPTSPAVTSKIKPSHFSQPIFVNFPKENMTYIMET